MVTGPRTPLEALEEEEPESEQEQEQEVCCEMQQTFCKTPEVSYLPEDETRWRSCSPVDLSRGATGACKNQIYRGMPDRRSPWFCPSLGAGAGRPMLETHRRNLAFRFPTPRPVSRSSAPKWG